MNKYTVYFKTVYSSIASTPPPLPHQAVCTLPAAIGRSIVGASVVKFPLSAYPLRRLKET